jgi:hypothetical protein
VDRHAAELERVATRLQRRVTALVTESPAKRHQIVGQVALAPKVVDWALRAASEAIDGPEPRRTFRDRLLQRPADRPPGRLTRPEHERAWMQRRVERLRSQGVDVFLAEDGRWMRRDSRGRVKPVETRTQLVQLRVRAGERAAAETARREALRLGLRVPPRGFKQWQTLDPRIYDVYRRSVAMHAGRIAHDAAVDTWRDAAFDRLEQRGWGWIRECEATACGACLALADGTVHPPGDRRFYRHTRCRCRPRAAYPGRRKPRTGQAIVDLLTDAELAKTFQGRGGAKKARALRTGQIALQDLLLVDANRVGHTDYVIGEKSVRDLPIDVTT